MENQPQPHLRWITKTQAGWKYAETAKRALRALGLIEAEAAKVAGNLKSWWRNASASLYPKTIRLRSLSGLALAKLNPSATPNPAPPARLSSQHPERCLTHTCRCGSHFVGAPSKADINQRVQVPSVETGTKRGLPCALKRGDPHRTESCVGCREADCEA